MDDLSSNKDVVRINAYDKLGSKVLLLSNLLQTLNWQKFVVILDNKFDLLWTPSLIQDLLSQENVITVARLVLQEHNSIGYVTEKLSALSTSFSRYLVLQNNIQIIRRTFRAAYYLKMSQGTFKWILQTDISLEHLRGENLPQGLFSIVPKPLPWSQGEVLFDAALVIHSAVRGWVAKRCMRLNGSFCASQLYSSGNLLRLVPKYFNVDCVSVSVGMGEGRGVEA